MDMLLRLVRVVPAHFLFEPSRLVVVLEPPDVCSHNAFQRVQHGARPKALHRTIPIGPCAQVDGVVIPVGETEPQQNAASCFQAESVDELLSHETHRGGAEDHDFSLPSARRSKFCMICCTRGSGPWGRLQWDQGSMWPGGELRPWDQKMVEALKTKFLFGPG